MAPIQPACGLVALLAIAAAITPGAPPSRPNIIFILGDDMGYGDVGFNAIPELQYNPGAGGRAWTPNPPRTPILDSLAASESTLIFDRAYSGSPVCSPTRSSILSGRTPDRECVFNAEGCGQEPAWSCVNPEPFPATVFTLAEATKAAGYATLHSGKFHLGDFFPKDNPDPSYAYRKWPVMNPGMLGFDDWFSTEASASSTMCNCGCNAHWPLEAPGCDIGGGEFVMGQSFACTNYWFPLDNTTRPEPECHDPSTATLACVGNYTEKIPGDDTEFMLKRFQAFLNASVAASTPFFAALWLHTNHVPHPALPSWYHAYTGTDGLPAGDYLGTISQMDASLGALVAMLAQTGVENNTLIWFTTDNGPHPGDKGEVGILPDVLTATNGLRQCKGSVFEGGIRVPGFVHWPGVISAQARTAVPVYTPDVLPTVLDILGIQHPHPTWATDGVSILPLLRGDAGFQRNQSLRWRLGSQVALLDSTGRYKLVRAPDAGQCKAEAANYSGLGPFLFDLLVDPTESSPVTDQPAILANLTAAMDAFVASIPTSQQFESGCMPPANSSTGAVLLQRGTGPTSCLAATGSANDSPINASADCSVDNAALNRWQANASTMALFLASAPSQCFHTNNAATHPCAPGTPVHLGDHCDNAMTLDVGAGTLAQPGCPGMCAAGTGEGGALALAPCTAAGAQGWVARNATLMASNSAPEGSSAVGGIDGTRWGGAYVQPFD